MKETDDTEAVNKAASVAVGVVSAVISLALAFLSIVLVTKYDGSDPQKVKNIVILLSIILPFVLFFGVIAILMLSTQVETRRELMSVKGWRLLAMFLFAIGVVGAVYGHWFALVLPSVMALFCLWKDIRFIEMMRAIRLIP